MQLRIDRAKQLLNDKTKRIDDIALELGFSDQSHLTRNFRQLVGVSPGQFRRSLR